MVVLIPHPTEELKLINIQKKLIEMLNTDDGTNIWYQQQPLWITLPSLELTTTAELKNFSHEIECITTVPLTLADSGAAVILPVTIKTKKEVLKTELPLVYKLKGTADVNSTVSAVETQNASVPPAFKQCQIGTAEQLHNTSATVQSSKTSSYILKDSVWFKQAK